MAKNYPADAPFVDANGMAISNAAWIYNSDLTAVTGFANKYWITQAFPDDTVTLMDQTARDAVDAAELSAQLDAVANQIDTGVQYQRGFALIILDEINALRTQASLPTRTPAQLKAALRSKLDEIS